jgi:hypothetical protein
VCTGHGRHRLTKAARQTPDVHLSATSSP